nr:polysaccharide biosynthesis protein [Aquabacterium sp.]
MRRAVLTLLAGGLLAQALPLLLGPWLTRLYSPAEFGVYHLFAAVAANAAVVACARYEFALPLANDDADAVALRALCQRLLLASTALAAIGGIAWAALSGQAWPLWLPAAVGALGLVSLATLNATRAERFPALAIARVLQHGGGALAQLGAGLL